VLEDLLETPHSELHRVTISTFNSSTLLSVSNNAADKLPSSILFLLSLYTLLTYVVWRA